MADELIVGVVRQLEHVARTAQHREKGGCEPEDVSESRALYLELRDERLHLHVAEHALRRFLTHHERPGDGAVVIAHRAVAVCPPDILEPAIALDGQVLVLMPCRALASHDERDLRSDGLPDISPEFPSARPERAGMAFTRSKAWTVRIVVELHELRSPPEKHRVPGHEHRADHRAQALRPATDRPERSARPIVLGAEARHLAAADKRRPRIGHAGRGRVNRRHRAGCVLLKRIIIRKFGVTWCSKASS